MAQNSNPFESIEIRFNQLESILLDIKHGPQNPNSSSPETPDRYEAGVNVACEELGVKPQTVYQNIDTIPCRKLHGKLYFNRAELQAYIRNEGKK